MHIVVNDIANALSLVDYTGPLFYVSIFAFESIIYKKRLNLIMLIKCIVEYLKHLQVIEIG